MVVDRKVIIGKIFKTLYIYEDSVLHRTDDYCKYIKKLKIFLAGLEDDEIEREALTIIKGLIALGMDDIDHQMVKSSVFKMIDMVKKEV